MRSEEDLSERTGDGREADADRARGNLEDFLELYLLERKGVHSAPSRASDLREFLERKGVHSAPRRASDLRECLSSIPDHVVLVFVGEEASREGSRAEGEALDPSDFLVRISDGIQRGETMHRPKEKEGPRRD